MEKSPKTDEELFVSFRDNDDRSSLQELIDRYHNSALAFTINRTGDIEQARDILQDSLIRMIKAAAQYNETRPFAPWFFAIIRNTCIDSQRKDVRDFHRAKTFALRSTTVTDPVYPDFSEDLLRSLSVDEREIVLLKVIQGMSFPEIADYCGCSTEAAKKRSQRAICKLRNIVKK